MGWLGLVPWRLVVVLMAAAGLFILGWMKGVAHEHTQTVLVQSAFDAFKGQQELEASKARERAAQDATADAQLHETVRNDYESKLGNLNARAELLRRQLATSGNSRSCTVSALPAAPRRTDGIPADTGQVSASPITLFAECAADYAREATKLMALQQWITGIQNIQQSPGSP